MWSRLGTGNAGAGVAALGFALGGVVVDRGALAPLTAALDEVGAAGGRASALPSLLGLPAWAVVGLGLAGIGLALSRLPAIGPARGHWRWPVTGLALGLVGVLAWVGGSLSGWRWGLSITGPSRSLAEGLLLAGADLGGWGPAMLLGIPLGSWLSARLRGPVGWRAPAASELPRRFLGGLLMGAGGTIAAGCNIGNALTGLSVLSTQSLVAVVGMVAGTAAAIRALDGEDRRAA